VAYGGAQEGAPASEGFSMIRLIERTPPKRAWFFGFADGTNLWEIECDVCGKKERVSRIYYDYGFGSLGLASPEEVGMRTIEYGKVNPRAMVICREHKDAEVEAKIKELE